MKHKLDFVTNSSSTSVVMWGVYLDESEIRDNETLMAKLKELAEKKEMVEDLEKGSLGYMVMELLEGFDTHTDYEGDGVYIGKSPFSMEEDETPRAFKEKLEAQLKEVGINSKVRQIIESWMDG